MISNYIEEILEKLWILSEEKKQTNVNINDLGSTKDETFINEALENNLIQKSSENIIQLTEKGRAQGRDVVRRHRLAERLLVDLLDVKGELINETACHFEHLLYKGIDDNICKLLGHPKLCPHGHNIPGGPCCKNKETGSRIIAALSELSPKEGGQIAYIHTKDQDKMQKLISMGILPGIDIRLLQSFPSFVFQMQNSQFAVDESIAKEIFVRVTQQQLP